MSSAAEVSDGLASAVDRVAASVVRVEGRWRSSSSGLIVAAEGHILTADHAIHRDEGIRVGFADGRDVPATLVGRDPGTDLALLDVEEKGLPALEVGDGASLKVGQLAVAVARPGRSVRASLGVVGALGAAAEPWRTPHGGKLDRYVEVAVAPQLGFSGGVFVDANGAAFGLNTSGILRGSSLAIGGPTLKRVLAAIAEHGGVRRGFLGVGAYPVRLPDPLKDKLGQPGGLLVVSVANDSPAQKGGILQGDILVALAGQPLRHVGDLVAQLEEERIGQELELKLVRAGEVKDAKVAIGARS